MRSEGEGECGTLLVGLISLAPGRAARPIHGRLEDGEVAFWLLALLKARPVELEPQWTLLADITVKIAKLPSIEAVGGGEEDVVVRLIELLLGEGSANIAGQGEHSLLKNEHRVHPPSAR